MLVCLCSCSEEHLEVSRLLHVSNPFIFLRRLDWQSCCFINKRNIDASDVLEKIHHSCLRSCEHLGSVVYWQRQLAARLLQRWLVAAVERIHGSVHFRIFCRDQPSKVLPQTRDSQLWRLHLEIALSCGQTEAIGSVLCLVGILQSCFVCESYHFVLCAILRFALLVSYLYCFRVHVGGHNLRQALFVLLLWGQFIVKLLDCLELAALDRSWRSELIFFVLGQIFHKWPLDALGRAQVAVTFFNWTCFSIT